MKISTAFCITISAIYLLYVAVGGVLAVSTTDDYRECQQDLAAAIKTRASTTPLSNVSKACSTMENVSSVGQVLLR